MRMEQILYCVARTLVALIQVLPLRLVVKLGRLGGTIAYCFDSRHRRVAIANLTRCFGNELSKQQIHALALENFRRIGENFAAAVRTSAMTDSEIERVLELVGLDQVMTRYGHRPGNWIVAIGHFGNFELYARAAHWVPGRQFATTYRALRQKSLNELMQNLRKRSGCLFFERRTEMNALREALRKGNLVLGFLSDQHAGDRGLPVQFFGELCSTTTAPAVFALRYGCPLFVAICYRVQLGKWRIEVGPEIQTHANGKPRPISDITFDITTAFESAVRRDPANWFWVHERWKPGKYRKTPARYQYDNP